MELSLVSISKRFFTISVEQKFIIYFLSVCVKNYIFHGVSFHLLSISLRNLLIVLNAKWKQSKVLATLADKAAAARARAFGAAATRHKSSPLSQVISRLVFRHTAASLFIMPLYITLNKLDFISHCAARATHLAQKSLRRALFFILYDIFCSRHRAKRRIKQTC